MRLPARGSLLETALASLVLTAAAICGINALHDEGVAKWVGIAIVVALVRWVRVRRGRVPLKSPIDPC